MPQTFGSAPERLLDPSIGGLELGLAVVGGFLTGSYVASLLGPSVGRWLHLAALPVLFVLGAGKLAMVLTGTGQGLPSDADWATAYLGPGPWGSLVPALPSNPSQAYEGLATLAVLAILTVAVLLGAFRRRDGRLFFVAIGLWAVARAVVSTTWRDPVVAGGLNAGGLDRGRRSPSGARVALVDPRPCAGADAATDGQRTARPSWPRPRPRSSGPIPETAPDASDARSIVMAPTHTRSSDDTGRRAGQSPDPTHRPPVGSATGSAAGSSPARPGARARSTTRRPAR